MVGALRFKFEVQQLLVLFIAFLRDVIGQSFPGWARCTPTILTESGSWFCFTKTDEGLFHYKLQSRALNDPRNARPEAFRTLTL